VVSAAFEKLSTTTVNNFAAFERFCSSFLAAHPPRREPRRGTSGLRTDAKPFSRYRDTPTQIEPGSKTRRLPAAASAIVVAPLRLCPVHQRFRDTTAMPF